MEGNESQWVEFLETYLCSASKLSDNYLRLRAEWALGEVVSSPPLEVERRPKVLKKFCYSVGNQLRSEALIWAVHKDWSG